MQVATASGGIVGDYSPRRLFIGGESVDGAAGEHFDTINPATGTTLCSVARGDAIDVDRAVKAARSAFEGPWRKTGPAQRQRVLERLAELVIVHGEELAVLDSLDMGSPLRWLRTAQRSD